MSKRTRQYIGILAALAAYYLVHEGAHLLYALITGVFRQINFMGLGVQIDVYADRMTDAPAESDGFGVYVKLERGDVSSIALQVGSFTKVCENADCALLKSGEWLFTGDDIAQHPRKKTAPSSLLSVRMMLMIRCWVKAPSSTTNRRKSCM